MICDWVKIILVSWFFSWMSKLLRDQITSLSILSTSENLSWNKLFVLWKWKKKRQKAKKLFSYLACWQGLREEFYKFNCQYTICFCCSFKPPSSNCVFNRWQKSYIPLGHCKIITIKTWIIIMKHTWCTKSAVWKGCLFCRKSVYISSWETISEALHGMPGAVATSLGRAALLS